MTTWTEIKNDPDYQGLSDTEKRKVAEGFFSKTISADPDYNALPDEEKQKVRFGFYAKTGFQSESQTRSQNEARVKAYNPFPNLKETGGGFSHLMSEEQASKFAEAAGRKFPKSKAASIGAAAVGALGQVLTPADLVLPIIGKLLLLKYAPKALKIAKVAEIKAGTKPEVFKAATEALSPAELNAITGTPEKAKAALTFVPPEGWKSPAATTTAGKPFTLQSALSEKDRAALEAFKAKLPKGPEITPRIAQGNVLAPKPAIIPTPPIIPAAHELAGNIRLSKYSPQAQEGIILANKATGVAERTPQTLEGMRVVGATPEGQAVFSAVAKAGSGALAGKTQLVRESLEKEASVFAQQAEAAVKAGGDELGSLFKTSPALKTEEQISKVAQSMGQTLAAFKQNASTAITKATIATLEKVKADLLATKSPFAEIHTKSIEKLQMALNKKELALSKLMPAYRKLMEVNDAAYTLWINSILSSPLTDIRNLGGNILFVVAKPVEKIMAAAVDNTLSLFTGKAPAHTFKETVKMVKAASKFMIGKGEKLPFNPAKSGFGKLDRPIQQFPGTIGKVIGAPTKALEIEDNLFKNLVAQMEYAALKSKGIKGDELTKRVLDEAAYRTYQDEAGPIVHWLMSGRNRVPGARWVIPFIRTPSKLLERGIERTPLGIVKIGGKLAKGVYKEAGGQGKLAEDIGNTVIGSVGSAWLAWQYGKGNITGAWPKNRRESEQWKAEGRKPYSYRTTDGWVALDKIEPFGAAVKSTIVVIDTFKNMADKDIPDKAAAAAANLGKELTRMSAFNGFNTFAQSISDPSRFASKTVSNVAAGFVPGAAKFATDYVPGLKDPLMRQKQNAVEMGQAKIPFAAKRLYPQLDIWGQPIRKEAFFTAVSRERGSKELDLLKDLDLPVPKYPVKMLGVNFSRDEAFNIRRKAGAIIKDFLSQYSGRKILDPRGLKTEIRTGIDDINNSVAQLEILNIDFTPNRQQSDVLSSAINKTAYKQLLPEQRRAVLMRIILGTQK